jgi:GntR family transcriptional regulator of vanillate catabolism
MVEQIGVSRTPVRMAMVRLEEEGLLVALRSGGFAVRGFTESEVRAAIEVRGTLEGLAARFAAERGLDEAGLSSLRACVERSKAALDGASSSPDQLRAYAALNEEFHRCIADLSGSPALMRQLDRAVALPFAAPGALLLAQASFGDPQTTLIVSQHHEQNILHAIERREGARAEALMREHARPAAGGLERILRDRAALALVPGASLIVMADTD